MRSVAQLTPDGMRASKRVLAAVLLAIMITVAAMAMVASHGRFTVDRSGASWGNRMVVVNVDLDGASWS